MAQSDGRRERPSDEGPEFRVPHAASLYGRLFEGGKILRIGPALEARLGVAEERPPLHG